MSNTDWRTVVADEGPAAAVRRAAAAPATGMSIYVDERDDLARDAARALLSRIAEAAGRSESFNHSVVIIQIAQAETIGERTGTFELVR